MKGVKEVKELNLNDLEKDINAKKADVEIKILSNTPSEKAYRTKPRDEDEIQVLHKLSILRWKKAVQEGKVKYISEREWYYEAD